MPLDAYLAAAINGPDAPEVPDLEVRTDAPEFSFSTWVAQNGDRSLSDFYVQTKQELDPARHASNALLCGLAILTLDKAGVVEKLIDKMLEDGPISEAEAVRRIEVLISNVE